MSCKNILIAWLFSVGEEEEGRTITSMSNDDDNIAYNAHYDIMICMSIFVRFFYALTLYVFITTIAVLGA